MTKQVTKPIKNVTYSYECRLNNRKDVKKIALQLNGKVYEFLAFKVKFKKNYKITKQVTKPIKNVTYSYKCRLNNREDARKIALQLNGNKHAYYTKIKYKGVVYYDVRCQN